MTITAPPVEEYSYKRLGGGDAPLALALAFEGDPIEPAHRVTSIEWEDATRALLSNLNQAYAGRRPRISAPVTSLRGRLQISDPDILRLDRQLGLWRGRGGQGQPIHLTGCEPGEARQRTREALLGWLANDLPTDDAETAPLVQELKHLVRDGQAIKATARRARVSDWAALQNGTTVPGDDNPQGYPDLADFVARRLESQEVLPGLGGLRRIVSSRLDANQAELLTAPILDQRTPFSVVVRVRVLSFPGRRTPVVVLELSRRVWAASLRPSYLVQRLTGNAFPADRSTALTFTLVLARLETEGRPAWSYEPDSDLSPIARAFGLPVRLSGAELLERGAQLPECRLLVVHKGGVGGRVSVKHGIPDADKQVAFRCVVEALAPSGIRPWQALREVGPRSRPTRDRDQWWREPESDERRKRQFEVRRVLERETIEARYNGPHSVVLGFHPQFLADAMHARATLLRLLEDQVRVECIPLPEGVHGPRGRLPERQRRNEARAEARADAWQPFVSEVRRYVQDAGSGLDGMLILAPKYYERLPDDLINKRVGRITLARHLSVPVQFLRPILDNWSLRSTDDPKVLFENCLLIAWRDLAWKTIGRVREVQLLQAARDIYRDTPGVAPPDRVVAVGVLRRNTTRSLFNESSFVPFAIELDAAQGTCEARFARESGTTFEITPRLQLADTLALLASSGPIQLAPDATDRRDQRRDRAGRFFHEVITDVCQRAERPLVMIDAVTCRDVWPWVADTRLDPSNVLIGSNPHAEADWKNARVIRVRTGNAPKVLWEYTALATSTTTSASFQYEIPVGADAQLFRVTDAALPVYLSFGSLLRTGMVAGVSCYRPVDGLKRQSVNGHNRYTRLQRRPWTHAWSTPSAVELTVVRAAPGESPDELARYAVSLRSLFGHIGDWTTKPAPLFFEAAMREYLADYDLDVEAEEEADPADVVTESEGSAEDDDEME